MRAGWDAVPAGEARKPRTRAAPGLRPGDTTVALPGAGCIGRSRSRFKKRGPGLMAGPPLGADPPANAAMGRREASGSFEDPQRFARGAA